MCAARSGVEGDTFVFEKWDRNEVNVLAGKDSLSREPHASRERKPGQYRIKPPDRMPVRARCPS